MDQTPRCKRIISGKTYNTETATMIAYHSSSDRPDEEALYKTRHGAYFVWWVDHQEPDERIFPLDLEKARAWMETHCPAEAFEAEFGIMPEAGSNEARLTVRIPVSLHQRVIAQADARKQSLNAWILRCLESEVRAAEAKES